ncbi:MAG: DUF58 domain-containing protein [Planctomycetales bacterium]|nr:DUF58 domain-containing protein [Planctomycetales bacterium]
MALLSGLVRRLRNVAQPFTVTGRLLMLAGFFCLLGIIDPSLAGLLSYIVVLNVVAFILGLCYRPRLSATTQLHHVAIKDQPFAITISIENVGRLPAYDLACHLIRMPWLNDQGAKVSFDSIAPGERAIATFILDPTRRGVFPLPPLRVASLFPASLFRFFSTYTLDETLVVAPSFDPINAEDLDELGQLDSKDTANVASGQGLHEYIGSCEFRHGMAVRRWDFASWARLGQPAIREFSNRPEAVAVLLVDSRDQTNALGQSDFEAVLSRAAAVVEYLDAERYAVMMFIAGSELECHDGRGLPSQRDELMTALANAKANRTNPHWELIGRELLLAATDEATHHWITHMRNEDLALEAQTLAEVLPGIRVHCVGDSGTTHPTSGTFIPATTAKH